jgi:hypothetical protein
VTALGAAALALLLGGAGQATAEFLTAVTLSGGSVYNGTIPAPLEMGWEFTPKSDILVTALGVWDAGSGSSSNVQPGTQVGLFRLGDFKELASVAVTDTTSPLQAQFRYVALASPVTLAGGQTYEVISYLPAGPFPGIVFSSTSFDPDPE